MEYAVISLIACLASVYTRYAVRSAEAAIANRRRPRAVLGLLVGIANAILAFCGIWYLISLSLASNETRDNKVVAYSLYAITAILCLALVSMLAKSVLRALFRGYSFKHE